MGLCSSWAVRTRLAAFYAAGAAGPLTSELQHVAGRHVAGRHVAGMSRFLGQGLPHVTQVAEIAR